MSIAYLDPGNIESDLQSGAAAGFKVNENMLIHPEKETAGVVLRAAEVDLGK